MRPKNRKLPAGTIRILLNLIPGSDEYSAYVSVRNKYQDEMSNRRKANLTGQVCKADTGNCELMRGALYDLDQVPQDNLPDYIDAAWKPKGRHALNSQIEATEQQTDGNTTLDDRDITLH